ncbi:MAG: hypothetical protein PHZ19_05735 [Candidatus Thermoplasmatota archaeon]|nr:hypothetical protein [Candidatus Thermoplasmatota archaeon]
MNLVYPLKTGSRQDEIKFSLRSVEKFVRGVDDIYVIGTETVPNTIFIEHPDSQPRPAANTYLKCRKACEIMPNFLWMNDDIYFTRPIHVDDIPLIHKGLLPDHNRTSHDYQDELGHTRRYLKSIGATTYSFEVHCPMPIVSDVFLRVTPIQLCTTGRPIVQWRSVYGNTCGFPSVKMNDNKIFGHKRYEPVNMLKPFFVSSSAKIHPSLLQWLKRL